MTYPQVDLGSVVDLQAGIGFPTRLQGKTSGKFPFAKVGDISRNGRTGKPILSTVDNYIDQTDVESLRAKIIPEGSILFAKIGEAIKQNHRVISHRSLLIDNNAMAAIPSEKIDNLYLYYFLKQVDFYRLAPATTVPALRKSDLEKIKIPLPPLAEQRRIASILDQADELRQKRQQAIEKLDQLLQATFIDMFGDPVINNKNLPTKSLGELGTWASGGTPSRSESTYFKGHIPWYTSGELNSIYINESIEKISELAIEKTSTKLIPVGSLLVGMYDTAAFKSSITIVPSSCNQAIAFTKLNNDLVNTLYVYYAIQLSKDSLKSMQRGVRQKNLNLSMVKSIEIPVPDIKLQNTFCEISNNLLKHKDILKKSSENLDILFKSLQNQAFSGTL